MPSSSHKLTFYWTTEALYVPRGDALCRDQCEVMERAITEGPGRYRVAYEIEVVAGTPPPGWEGMAVVRGEPARPRPRRPS